jgi:hypothetical protein
MKANPGRIILHIESPTAVTKEMQISAESAASFYRKGMVDAPIEVIVVGP